MTLRRRSFLQAALLSAGLSYPILHLRSNTLVASWATATPIPIKTQEIYPTVHKGELIVAGGIASKAGVPYFADSVFAYSPSEDGWRPLPDLPESLHHVALVSTGNDLLAIGGFNGGYTHVWRMRDRVYQLEDDEWVLHSNLPTRQAEGVVTHHNGRIHIVTGQQPRGEANKARSDHREGNLHWYWNGASWESLAPIPTPSNSATGGWIGNTLVISGGRTAAGNLTATEIYDAKEDRWRSGTPMPLPQAGTAGVTTADSLIVFGGEIFSPSAAVFPNVWRYHLATDR